MNPLYPSTPDLFTPLHDSSSKNESASFPLDGIELATVSNEQLATLGRVAPTIYSLWSTHVVRLSSTLVLKFGEAIQMQEVAAMICALSCPDVRTPKLHRYFFTQSETSTFDQCGYIVMDYVKGSTLFDIWHDISCERRADIIDQITAMISQIQAISFDRPGPLDGGPCRGFWFSDYGAGPFKDKGEFNSWFTHKLEFSKKVGQAREDLMPFDYSSFVLVHQDLSPDNIILDPDGNVWIIDWGNAGAYPKIFEAATLCKPSRFSEFNALLLPHIYNNTAEKDQLMGALWAILSTPY